MEEVVDKIIQQLETLVKTEDFINVLDVASEVKLDDPGIVTVDEYPYIFVSPVRDGPVSETAGRSGYDVRRLDISIGVVINAADYFNPMISEAYGTRQLIQSTTLIRSDLRRLAKRSLDGLSGVRSMIVSSTDYVPDIRGDTIVKMAVTHISVERQYQHED